MSDTRTEVRRFICHVGSADFPVNEKFVVLESDHVAAMASKNKKIRFLEMVRDDSQKTISQFSKDNDTLTVALVAARVENAKIAKLVNAGKACFPDGKLEDFWGAYDLWNALVEIEGK